MNRHITTLVIPTYNRPEQLKRLVNYIIKVFDLTKTKVLILDGSDSRMITPYEDWSKNNIKYKYYGSNVSMLERWLDGLLEVDTELVGFVADDDIPHPEGYENCMEFLSGNPQYGAAHGSYPGFDLNNKTITIYSCYKPFSIEDDDPSTRLYYFLNNYVPITYALYKTGFLKTAFQETMDSVEEESLYNWFELLLGCIPVVLGKVKYIDCPYYARNFGPSIPRPPFPYYKIFYDESFSNEYGLIKKAIIKHYPFYVDKNEDYKDKISTAIDISFANYHSIYFNKKMIANDFNSLFNQGNNKIRNSCVYAKLKNVYQMINLYRRQVLGLRHKGFFSPLVRKAYFDEE